MPVELAQDEHYWNCSFISIASDCSLEWNNETRSVPDIVCLIKEHSSS